MDVYIIFGPTVAKYIAASIVGATMKIAVTIWNNRVSPVFDVAGKVLLFNTADKNICSERQLLLPDTCVAAKVLSLTGAGTDILVCGAISRDAHQFALNAGIKVYPFIAGDVMEVLQACLTDRLIEGGFEMPGCACRMACSGKGRQSRRRERVTGSAFFCKQQPEIKEV
jgi:predicted Fe-Mo cluster-binding NifX family protein